ncbi:Translin-associated protein X [Lachnellula willkommii]|uniref:Translin-associated protein X n=1 Tax=Lachnellula willkommii TaxID=215461 RepID=A0A559LYN0_9HELO|nr:Translin-associated protein X [Lachnellula willkommii]
MEPPPSPTEAMNGLSITSHPQSKSESMSEQMPGVKRHHDGAEKEKDVNANASPFMPMFEAFRDELDEHHDRRERIIKASRDITAASKKMHVPPLPYPKYSKKSRLEPTNSNQYILPPKSVTNRVRTLKSDIPAKIASETAERYTAMQKQFSAIAPDLTGINAWRYQRQISGGIQEYMEAVSFEHYLRYQALITISEAAGTLQGGIELTGDDYVLGLFDLVGELMRFAITTMATTGSLPGGGGGSSEKRDILVDLRELRTCFQALDTGSCGGTGLGKDVEKKMEVMKTCVEKVESAVYGLIIRGRERPKGWVPGIADERGVVESY